MCMCMIYIEYKYVSICYVLHHYKLHQMASIYNLYIVFLCDDACSLIFLSKYYVHITIKDYVCVV